MGGRRPTPSALKLVTGNPGKRPLNKKEPPLARLTDGQKVAFVDVAYNIGVSGFCGSSMARRTNARDMVGACNSLLMWNKVGGKEVRGLTRRRLAKRELCLKGLP